MKNADMPAWPIVSRGVIYDANCEMLKDTFAATGLTKREDFAKFAMQGLLANSDFFGAAITQAQEAGADLEDVVAVGALAFADSLLIVLDKIDG